MDVALACLKEHLDAENRHDLEAILATYVPDPRVTINGQTFQGIERVRFFHERFGFGGNGAFSELKVDERKRHPSGNAIVIEQTVSGMHTGTWQGIPPTHKRFEVLACTVYTFADGKLSSEDVYFDASAIYRQLGASP